MATKLGTVRDELGYDSITDMLEEASSDSIVPGICTAPGCNHIESELEPDCEDATCEVCGEKSVSSILIIARVI